MVKTKRALFQEFVNVVVENHPYDVPEIICTEIKHAYKPYYDWVKQETK